MSTYRRDLFADEDAALVAARKRHAELGLPPIHISDEEGRLLQVLLRAVGAKRVLEIGTLGGYSGIWIARALGPAGRLTTIEIDPRHAAAARESFREARLSRRIELIEGRAQDILPTLDPGFDAVFIDADKIHQPRYLRESVRLLRLGGLLLVDNAHLDGRVVDSRDILPDVKAVRKANQMAASDPRLFGTIIPIRDGLLAAIKVGD